MPCQRFQHSKITAPDVAQNLNKLIVEFGSIRLPQQIQVFCVEQIYIGRFWKDFDGTGCWTHVDTQHHCWIHSVHVWCLLHILSRRILAWSLPRSHFHPPKALNFYAFKNEDDNWPSHTCHTKRLENVVRSWPRWMFCKAFKKQKLCSSRRIQKTCLVGIAKSSADFCTWLSLVITPHKLSVSILFVCIATHVPWRRANKNLFSGNCQVICWFLRVLQLGHYSTQHTCLST